MPDVFPILVLERVFLWTIRHGEQTSEAHDARAQTQRSNDFEIRSPVVDVLGVRDFVHRPDSVYHGLPATALLSHPWLRVVHLAEVLATPHYGHGGGRAQTYLNGVTGV